LETTKAINYLLFHNPFVTDIDLQTWRWVNTILLSYKFYLHQQMLGTLMFTCSYMFRRIRHFQAAYTNVVKTCNNKILL